MAVNAKEALQKEKEDTANAMTKRGVAKAIGIAFSGGGVRAAAFACGLLNALSEKKMLKEVSCISAVSGGTYTSTAFASHVLKAGSPGQGQSLDGFYKEVVNQLQGRMRRNIGYLVRTRDRWSEFLTPATDGSGYFPPCLDKVILLLPIAGSLILSPLLLMLYIVMPVSVFMNVKNGILLQGVLCDPEFLGSNTFTSVYPVIRLFVSDVGKFLGKAFVGTIAASLCTSMLRKCKPAGLHVDSATSSSSRSRCCMWTFMYLTSRSIRQLLVRLSVLMFMYLGAVSIAMFTQWCSMGYARDNPYIVQACHCYIVNSLSSGPNAKIGMAGQYCQPLETKPGEDQKQGSSYSGRAFLHHHGVHGAVEPTIMSSLLSKMVPQNGSRATCEAEDYAGNFSELFQQTYMNATWTQDHVSGPFIPGSQEPKGTVFLFVQINVVLVIVSVFFLAWDSLIMRMLLASLAPMWAMYLTASFARWAIFGPITSQCLFFDILGTFLKYSKVNVELVYFISCAAIIVSLPFYKYLHSSLHIYYRRSLHQAYYADGKDLPLKDVSPAKNCYCPALVLGACVNDYGRPTDNTYHEEFSFTPWYSGGARTGFWSTCVDMSKAMSVSGAALDAAMLMQADKVSVRFLMTLLSLQMGDWVKIHDGIKEDFVHGIHRSLLGGCYTALVGFFYFFITVCYLTWKFDWHTPCNPKSWIETAGILAGILLGSAFIAHWPVLDCLMRSPIVQKIQITLQHHFQSTRVPDYLYLSDGGLIECLGLLGLLRRKHRWMIVTDATNSKDDPTFCLRQTIKLAKAEKLCSFFDPDAPERCVDFKLKEFKDSQEPFLHLRVRYETSAVGDDFEFGDVYFVRMRNTHVHNVAAPVSACYPCCAPCCRCCGTFPDISNANQFITPEMFDGLSRLGLRLCVEALAHMRGRMGACQLEV